MAEFIEKLKAKPWVAHLLEAVARFGERLGGQFAAAITYFSVLAIVPVLMVAFAALGLTLTLFLPDVLDQAKAWITDTVSGSGDLGDQLSAVVDQAFNSWRGVGIVGLLSAAWAGANWVNNIRSAVRAMMRPDFDMAEDKPNIVVQTLKNLGILLALFVLVALSMAMTTVAMAARDLVGEFLGLDRVPGGGVLLSLLPVVGTLLAGFLLFLFLFKVFPEKRVPTPVLVHAWLVPMLLINTMVNIRGMSQHTLLEDADHPVRGSRTILTNPVTTFFMCNESFHLEHHLYPRVPWYHLPELHRRPRPLLEAERAVFIPSYGSFVREFVRATFTRGAR